jgi:GxxExxY protein
MNHEGTKNANSRTIGQLGDELESLAHATIGAALEVHKLLGPGYLESVYEEALSIEMRLRNVPFERQVPISVYYKGESIGESRLDYVVGKQLVVELKAVEQFAPIHTAQVISYLRSTNFQLGLLLNFNVSLMKDGIRRIVLTPRES